MNIEMIFLTLYKDISWGIINYVMNVFENTPASFRHRGIKAQPQNMFVNSFQGLRGDTSHGN